VALEHAGARFALRQQGFLVVFGAVRQRLVGGREIQDRREPQPLGFAQQAARHPHRMRRVGGDLVGDLARLDHQLVVRHHLGNQAAGQGFLRAQHVAGQAHLGGLGKADHARQQEGAAIAGHDADLDEALGEAGALASDAHVAHAGQVAAGADGRTVHRGDQRHLGLLDGQRYPLDAVAVIGAGHRRAVRGQAAAAAVRHLLDVAAGGEGAAGAGDDADADVVVLVHPLDRGAELVDHVGNRVAVLRVV
jgi:hypothetical protein